MPVSVKKNTPPDENPLGKISLDSTRSKAGKHFLPQDSMTKARKIMLLFGCTDAGGEEILCQTATVLWFMLQPSCGYPLGTHYYITVKP